MNERDALQCNLKAAITGDVRAREIIVDWVRPTISWRMTDRVRKATLAIDAEDVVQEAFASVLDAWDRFHGDSLPEFESWVHTIAVNKLRDALRRNQRRRDSEDQFLDFETAAPCDAEARTERLGTIGEPGTSAGGREVRQAVGRMVRSHREALLLREWLELPIGTTAFILGRTHDGVSSLHRRARQELGQLLESSHKTSDGSDAPVRFYGTREIESPTVTGSHTPDFQTAITRP